MSQTAVKSQTQLDLLSLALGSGTLDDVRRMLSDMPAADVAYLLESSPT